MTGSAEATHRIAERALGALKKIGLAATARNYELWYAHAAGRNPALSQHLQTVMDASGRVEQEAADRLYKTYIQHADLSRDVIDLVARLQAEVASIHDVIEETGETAQGRGEKLKDVSEQLRQSTEDYPAVGALLESVVAVAKDMREQNERLEARLAESAGEISALQRNVENIQAEAQKDPLTGVANRSLFDRFFQQEIAEAAASGEALSLIMTDIDYFKKFNDQWGHQTGDQVLRLVAAVMKSNVKGQDLLARYGGEEFAVVLPKTSVDDARMLAERIRRSVESRRLRKRRTNEDLGIITISIGVSLHRPSDTMETMIERADRCLYAAKDTGRNRVVDEGELNARADRSGTA